eukprot:g12330.t1
MDQFLAVLREEVAKVDRYFEVEVQVWLQRLRAVWRAWRIAAAGASSSTTFTTASAAAADQVESELAFLGAQLEELDTFRRINYTGFRKILKKAEKKFAASFPATEEGGEFETPGAVLRDFEKEEVESAIFLATDLDWLVAAMSYVFATLRSAATGASAVSDDVIIAANELWQVEESERVAFLVDCVRHFRIGDLLDRNDSAELLDRADSVVPTLEVAVSCGRKWLWEAELEFDGDDRLSVQWCSASSSFSAFLGRDGEEECFSDVTEFRESKLMSFSEEFRNLCNHDERQRFSDPEAAQAEGVGRPCGVTVSAMAAAPQEFWSASTKLQTQKTEEDLFVEFHDNVEIPKVLVDADSMKTLVPLEPKTYLANERNLVQWVELAVLIFGAACALLQQSANDVVVGAAASSTSNPNVSSSSSMSLKVAVDSYTGMLLVAVAAVQFWLGLWLYVMRSECISNGLLYARYFHTRAGPVLAAGGILVALCAHVYASLVV